MTWIADIESTIFSVVQARAKPKLQGNYPSINFTTLQSVNKKPKFPNVYIHLLPMAELAEDTESVNINAVLATFQIDVTSNTTQGDAKKVIYTIADILKELRFNITTAPTFYIENDIYRGTMRVRRSIANKDIL